MTPSSQELESPANPVRFTYQRADYIMGFLSLDHGPMDWRADRAAEDRASESSTETPTPEAPERSRLVPIRCQSSRIPNDVRTANPAKI